MSNTKQKLLIFFAAISAGTLLISNLAAVKLWDFFGIAVDGGVVVFPLTYIIGDLIVECYGKKIADSVIISGSLLSPTLCNVKLKDESIAGAGKIKGHHDLVFKTVAHVIKQSAWM